MQRDVQRNRFACQWAAIRAASIYFALLSACLLFGQFSVYAQQTSATLVGTLSDANGAVVANAQIKIANLATGSAREATSDGSGNYVFSFWELYT